MVSSRGRALLPPHKREKAPCDARSIPDVPTPNQAHRYILFLFYSCLFSCLKPSYLLNSCVLYDRMFVIEMLWGNDNGLPLSITLPDILHFAGDLEEVKR